MCKTPTGNHSKLRSTASIKTNTGGATLPQLFDIMTVIIDGKEFVPKDSVKIQVHGRNFDSVGNWLDNVHSQLISKWHKQLKVGEVPPPESYKHMQNITDFEDFVRKYLGFKYDEEAFRFIECNNDER